ASTPNVLVVDRTLGELDVDSRRRFHAALRSNADAPLLVTVQDAHDLQSDLFIMVSRGILTSTSAPADCHLEDAHSDSALTVHMQQAPPAGPRTPLVALRSLSMIRDGRSVLTLPTLAISTGEFHWVMGPNGCGKTSLFEGLVGFLPMHCVPDRT